MSTSPDVGAGRPPERPHVVIIGGGFGGLDAARSFADKPIRVTLIDRRNHHVFQPLLYQ
ncbi:MAG: FAD-dependent oxidoreductase, partial [Thermomicrobiales bacterium]